MLNKQFKVKSLNKSSIPFSRKLGVFDKLSFSRCVSLGSRAAIYKYVFYFVGM
jgi:hypothetical protein